jgi:hypothetical protein
MVCFWPAAVPLFGHLLLSASAAELASTFFDVTMEPPEPAYQMWDSATDSAADSNTTIHIAGRGQVVAPGKQAWKNSSGALLGSALFYILPSLVTAKEVKRLRALVRDDPFDVDTDSVDGQWTHELYLESNGSFDNAARFVGKADALSPEVAAKRKALRKRVGAITQRIVRERVAPLVRARYPRLCGRSAARACTLCHSLIRRYLPDERRSHGLHFDLQSAVTVVVSLSDLTLVEVRWRHSSPYWPPLACFTLPGQRATSARFRGREGATRPRQSRRFCTLNTQDHGREYQGGLRIQADGDTAQLLPLARGDALMHESDLQVRSYVYVVIRKEGRK